MPPIAVGTPVVPANPYPVPVSGTPGPRPVNGLYPPSTVATQVVPYSPIVLPNEKLGAKDIDE
jgi:hypothetical protein